MSDCSYCQRPVSFGATRCNTETCYLQHIERLRSQLRDLEVELSHEKAEVARLVRELNAKPRSAP